MKHVFISYSRNDQPHVSKVCSLLDQHDIPYWIDTKEISPGKAYDVLIPDAINNADVVLLLVSRHALESTNVANEVRIAINYKKNIIPYMLEDVLLTGPFIYHIPSNNRINAFSGDPSEIHKLIRYLKEKPDGQTKATPENPGSISNNPREEAELHTKKSPTDHLTCPRCGAVRLDARKKADQDTDYGAFNFASILTAALSAISVGNLLREGIPNLATGLISIVALYFIIFVFSLGFLHFVGFLFRMIRSLWKRKTADPDLQKWEIVCGVCSKKFTASLPMDAETESFILEPVVFQVDDSEENDDHLFSRWFDSSDE